MSPKIFLSIFVSLLIVNCAHSGPVKSSKPNVSLLPTLPATIPVPFPTVHIDETYYFMNWVGDLELTGTVSGLDIITDNVTYDCNYNEGHFNIDIPNLTLQGSFNVSATETYSDSSEYKWSTILGPGSFSLNQPFAFDAYGRLGRGEVGLKFETFYTTPTLPEALITRENIVVESSATMTDVEKNELISYFLFLFSDKIHYLGQDHMRGLLEKILADYTLAQFIEVTGAVCKNN